VVFEIRIKEPFNTHTHTNTAEQNLRLEKNVTAQNSCKQDFFFLPFSPRDVREEKAADDTHAPEIHNDHGQLPAN
jgi:hypothetical protein